ncbi:MAG: hypothetical protein LBQ12_09120, partial [Deltaproteobacteria bacterium]|nr:hypothetical protein [Deltaproteobacteria bacterium]
MLAPWMSYEALARYWLTPNEPPVAGTRRAGSLKATGFFFEGMTLDCEGLKLPPVELAEALPQQTLALKTAVHVAKAAGLDPKNFPEGLDRDRVGVFVGVDTDPRAADWAVRWLAPLRAAEALKLRGRLPEAEEGEFLAAARDASGPPLTHSRVLGALGSFTASRLARYLGTGGPAFTLSEEKDSGLRALREAIRFLHDGTLDLAYVGVVDTFGDPKTAALAPKTIWVEGAAGMLLANDRGAALLPPLAELKIDGPSFRLGPLSGLFAVNRSGFYLRHHLLPLGRGHGFCYWVKNQDDPARELSGQGYALKELEGSTPRALTVPPEPVRPDSWFFIRGDDPGQVSENLKLLLELAERHPAPQEFQFLPWRFKAEQGELSGKPALAILAKSVHELNALAKKALAGEFADDPKPRLFKAQPQPLSGKTMFLFPGSGAVYKGLGRNLCLAFPDIASVLERESERPRDIFQPELFWEPNLRRPALRESVLCQCLFGVMAYRVLSKLGISPDFLGGVSVGEATALLASGIWPGLLQMYLDFKGSPLWNGELTPPDFRILRSYWSWPPHKALKWSAGVFQKSAAQVEKAIDKLAPAMRRRAYLLIEYTADECLCGGESEAFQALAQQLDCPYTPLDDCPALHMAAAGPARDQFLEFQRRETAAIPGTEFYSTYRGAPVQQDSASVAEAVALQFMNPVRFPRMIERAWQDGARFFVELGPGATVSRMVKSILGSKPHLAQSIAATPVDEGWAGISRVVAELFLSGYPLVPEDIIPCPSPPREDGVRVPISLDPPQLAWPAAPHPERAGEMAARPGAPPAPSDASDYLSWLQEETAGAGGTAGAAGTAGQVGVPGQPGAAGAAGAPARGGASAAGQAPPPPGPTAGSPAGSKPGAPSPGADAIPGPQGFPRPPLASPPFPERTGPQGPKGPPSDGPRRPGQILGRPGLRTVEIPPNPRMLAKAQARMGGGRTVVEISQSAGARRAFEAAKASLFPDRPGPSASPPAGPQEPRTAEILGLRPREPGEAGQRQGPARAPAQGAAQGPAIPGAPSASHAPPFPPQALAPAPEEAFPEAFKQGSAVADAPPETIGLPDRGSIPAHPKTP